MGKFPDSLIVKAFIFYVEMIIANEEMRGTVNVEQFGKFVNKSITHFALKNSLLYMLSMMEIRIGISKLHLPTNQNQSKKCIWCMSNSRRKPVRDRAVVIHCPLTSTA